MKDSNPHHDDAGESVRLTLCIEAHEDVAFGDLLRKMADRLDVGHIAVERSYPVLDDNGNRVGSLLLEAVR
jgi:hypothetical protein